MKEIGLDYEFKCVVAKEHRVTIEHVALMLANPCPPPPSWWEEHCYLVNGHWFPGVLADRRFDFCGYDTKYDRHWPLIQLTFHFMLGYKRYEFCNGSAGVTHMESMESLFRRIKSICVQAVVEDYNTIFADIEERLGYLAETARGQPKSDIPRKNDARKPISSWRRIFNLKQNYRLLARLVYIHVFERYKLRARLVRDSLAYPTEGNEVIFR
jgi:hypothetical protein